MLLEPLVPEPELELPEDESLEPELAPPLEPLDGLFVVSLELDEELDGLDGEADGEVLDELEPADEGLDGEVVEPDAEDEDGLDGEVLLEGALVAPRDELRSPLPLLSQPVTSAVPSASETAMASVDNLMWPPWLGYRELAASNGPAICRR